MSIKINVMCFPSFPCTFLLEKKSNANGTSGSHGQMVYALFATLSNKADVKPPVAQSACALFLCWRLKKNDGKKITSI